MPLKAPTLHGTETGMVLYIAFVPDTRPGCTALLAQGKILLNNVTQYRDACRGAVICMFCSERRCWWTSWLDI